MGRMGHNQPPIKSVFRNAMEGDSYTVILNDCLQNAELSLAAKGLLAELLSMPEDWVFVAKKLIRKGCKRDKLYSIIAELIESGYMGREDKRDDKNQFSGHFYWVSDKPYPEYPEAGVFEPRAENPEVEKSPIKTTADGKTGSGDTPPPVSGFAVSGKTESGIKKNKLIIETNTPLKGPPNEISEDEIFSEKEIARGTRLPENWQPDEKLLAWAKEKLILTAEQLETETENFRDYWIAESGRKATKKDWSATWRVWVRKTDKFERNRIASIQRSDQRYQSRVTGEALPELGITEKYPWQENPSSYRNLSAERWINGIQAAKPNGHWPIDKFGPYVDHPDCLMPEKVKEWCLATYGSKYLTQDRKGN